MRWMLALALLLAAPSAAPPVLAQVDAATARVADDAMQARLRAVHLVMEVPHVDLLVNGVAVQTRLPVGYISDYLELAPGAYRVAIVPTGRSAAEALVGPLELRLAAGHRYTLALVGRLGDDTVRPLLIDHPANNQRARRLAGREIAIATNDLAGAGTFDPTLDGMGQEGIA